jgi:hypothetical protein
MRVGLILVFVVSAFAAASCSQGVGDRCVQNSDCSSGICSVPGNVNGGTCLPANSTTPGTGGTSAVGGQSGQGGEAGQGGAGGQGGMTTDAAQDASTDGG